MAPEKRQCLLALAGLTAVSLAFGVMLQLAKVPLGLPYTGVIAAGFFAIGLLFARKGLGLSWLTKAALGVAGAGTVLSVAGTALTTSILRPTLGTAPLVQPHVWLTAIGAAILVRTLPVALGAILGAPKDAQPEPQGFVAVPPVAPALLVAGLALSHVFLLVQARGSGVEVPIYGILFITAPIGMLMAIVGLVMSACRNRYGGAVVLGVVFYGLMAAGLFGLMSLAGVRFTIPP